jgi:hypothetical protein
MTQQGKMGNRDRKDELRPFTVLTQLDNYGLRILLRFPNLVQSPYGKRASSSASLCSSMRVPT